MTSAEILMAIKSFRATHPDEARRFGVRRDNIQYSAGDEMHYSKRWDDNCGTDESLVGTCSINLDRDGFFLSDFNSEEEDIACIEAALRDVKIYQGEHMYIIAGRYEECGEDENEIVIYNDFSAAICVAEI